MTTAAEALRLNIGAGGIQIPGFTPIDRKLGSEAFPLPYPDNSVEEIRASHILEHFTFCDAEKAVKEWVRVLKPGGRLRVAVPDVDKACAWPDKQERLFFLMGGQIDADDIHMSAYDAARLESLLHHAGLKWIEPWESHNTDTASHPCSLNRQGIKPVVTLPDVQTDAAVKPALPKSAITVQSDQAIIRCGAYLTLPRYEAVAARLIIEQALRELNIPCTTSQGVFWGQCMQRMFQEAVDADLDWILSLDSDSLFSSEQLSLLCDVFAQTPEADAMAALQCRRGAPYPLMTTGASVDSTIQIIRDKPIKVTTAHFGLTLIRVDALKKIAKPWFISRPSASGDWDDDRLDDDIWFWHQWRLAGNTIYVAPQVSIGHLEETVVAFDEDCNPQHMYVHQWREKNLKSQKS